MTTTEQPSLDYVVALARRLSPAQQADLVAQIAPTIALALKFDTADAAKEDPWKVLERLREDFRQQGPITPTITDELLASRR